MVGGFAARSGSAVVDASRPTVPSGGNRTTLAEGNKPLPTARTSAGAPRFQVGIDVSQRSELSRECGIRRRAAFAARVKIAAAKQVGHGDHGRSHRPVFVAPLGPGQIVVEPKKEPHPGLCGVHQLTDRSYQFGGLKGLAQHPAAAKQRRQPRVRHGRHIQQRQLIGECQKERRLIGDQYARQGPAFEQGLAVIPRGCLGLVTTSAQKALNKLLNLRIFHNHNRAAVRANGLNGTTLRIAQIVSHLP